MKRLITLATLLVSSLASAQHLHQHPAGQEQNARLPGAPYAGMQQREVKAFSAQQMEDLRSGKGMSLALPAELNGYPGPSHVLALADQLRLSETQVAKTWQLFSAMQRETIELGERLILAEAALDRLFREKGASWESVQAATTDAARIHGALRAAHLRYHLSMADVLEPAQIKEYERLRGYR
ncbi:hypothetical protein [Noviherbaspirillum denitrificans]|uniref:Periplasmic heavy metal sensor n=1 Tax=Noviherbaspirillum denitrificans TaxID=1968433 RepID=A0A254TKI0_9BURK|nr:hypothetical protein [Noviherbaspirillum denitrificans]OWW21822.1 hypothetical protein AYR66_22330 [Noviherbaspirillum denitrificans]